MVHGRYQDVMFSNPDAGAVPGIGNRSLGGGVFQGTIHINRHALDESAGAGRDRNIATHLVAVIRRIAHCNDRARAASRGGAR